MALGSTSLGNKKWIFLTANKEFHRLIIHVQIVCHDSKGSCIQRESAFTVPVLGLWVGSKRVQEVGPDRNISADPNPRQSRAE